MCPHPRQHFRQHLNAAAASATELPTCVSHHSRTHTEETQKKHCEDTVCVSTSWCTHTFLHHVWTATLRVFYLISADGSRSRCAAGILSLHLSWRLSLRRCCLLSLPGESELADHHIAGEEEEEEEEEVDEHRCSVQAGWRSLWRRKRSRGTTRGTWSKVSISPITPPLSGSGGGMSQCTVTGCLLGSFFYFLLFIFQFYYRQSLLSWSFNLDYYYLFRYYYYYVHYTFAISSL